jgi:hypothetical protein
MKLPLRLGLVALGLAATTLSAQANMLTKADYERVHSFAVKLVAEGMDITEAMKQTTDLSLSLCLGRIHDTAADVAKSMVYIRNLITLGAQMKDETDELLVLNALSLALRSLTDEISTYRKTINANMTLCSNSATVNVKAQTVLNAFTELNQRVTVLSKRVAKALPPSP